MTHRFRPARAFAALAVLTGGLAAAGTIPAEALPPRFAYGEVVDYPLVFPAATPHVLGSGSHFDDPRGTEDHHAQDIMADKMTEVYAVASGTVTWIGTTCCTVTIAHDDGWESHYIHLNNDTPGTDDGQAWGIAPGVVRGARVTRGQLIGWVGDSGNAEDTPPHLHFELWAPGDVAVDGFASLEEAEAAQGYSCAGQKATRVDTNGDHRIRGTALADVIVGTDDADTIAAGAGDDLVCSRGGDDTVDGGGGVDTLLGGDGADHLNGGAGPAPDLLFGGEGDDVLAGGDGGDLLAGQNGDDRLRGGPGDDDVLGGPGRDLLIASPGTDYLNGGRGRDALTLAPAGDAVAVDLAAGTAAGGVTATLAGLEVVHGSPYADALTGDDRRNALLGRAGDDVLAGAEGNDRLIGGPGEDTLAGGPGDDRLDGGDGEGDDADGGDGTDVCSAEITLACEG